MTTIAWATDVHLDHVPEHNIPEFAKKLAATNAENVLLTGDISNAKQIVYHLSIIEKVVQRPVYVVLGNHDYYGGSIEAVRKQMHELTNLSPYTRYLPTMPYQLLPGEVALVGHDCWYDAGHGINDKTWALNDWRYIREYENALTDNGIVDYEKVVAVSRKLSHEGAKHVHDGIKNAVRYANTIIVASHVPPFPEAHMHLGTPGEAHAHPWFVSKYLGDVLRDAAQTFPDKKFISISGHTHGRYKGNITKNLEVLVGAAEYHKPQVETIINV